MSLRAILVLLLLLLGLGLVVLGAFVSGFYIGRSGESTQFSPIKIMASILGEEEEMYKSAAQSQLQGQQREIMTRREALTASAFPQKIEATRFQSRTHNKSRKQINVRKPQLEPNTSNSMITMGTRAWLNQYLRPNQTNTTAIPYVRSNLLFSRFAVFTSAGDRSNLRKWLPPANEQRAFNLIVVYYGRAVEDKYLDVADIYFRRKDGKYPNLHFMIGNFGDLFKQYEAVWVPDDDILIDHAGIAHLFQIRAKHRIRVLQPAFNPQKSRISHRITQQVIGSSMIRFTNFVEMTCPLFDMSALMKFMTEFDPLVKGWGSDFLFLCSLREEGQIIDYRGMFLKGKIAIVDSVPCVNPRTVDKDGQNREIMRLQSNVERIKHFVAALQKRDYTVWSCFRGMGPKRYEPCLKTLRNITYVDNKCFREHAKSCRYNFDTFYSVPDLN